MPIKTARLKTITKLGYADDCPQIDCAEVQLEDNGLGALITPEGDVMFSGLVPAQSDKGTTFLFGVLSADRIYEISLEPSDNDSKFSVLTVSFADTENNRVAAGFGVLPMEQAFCFVGWLEEVNSRIRRGKVLSPVTQAALSQFRNG